MNTPNSIHSTPAWVDELLRWVQSQLAEGDIIKKHRVLRGITPTECLMTVQTDSGRFYFKSVNEWMKYEPELVNILSGLYPRHFPAVIGIDDKRHWLLMREVDGTALKDVTDYSRWMEALRDFSKIQCDCTGRVDYLLTINCPDWRLDKMAIKIDQFFTFMDAYEPQWKMHADQYKQLDLTKMAQRLEQIRFQLDDYGLPSSLVHGDFHLDNIMITTQSSVYLDWAEGYLGPPFFALADFLGYIGYTRPDLSSIFPLLRSSYLEPWSGFMRMDDLINVFHLSRPLAVLRYAMRIIENRSNYSDISVEMKGSLAKYLHSLIRQIDHYAKLSRTEFGH